MRNQTSITVRISVQLLLEIQHKWCTDHVQVMAGRTNNVIQDAMHVFLTPLDGFVSCSPGLETIQPISQGVLVSWAADVVGFTLAGTGGTATIWTPHLPQ